jgi:hypothetical protein
VGATKTKSNTVNKRTLVYYKGAVFKKIFIKDVGLSSLNKRLL